MDKKTVKYSVIVPVRKYHNHLDSVFNRLDRLARSRSDIELIFVQNGCDLLRWASDKPALQLVNEERLGPSFARNAGAQIAKGAFLLFIDDDVLVGPNLFEAIDESLNQKSWISAIALNVECGKLKDCSLHEFRKNLKTHVTRGTESYLRGKLIPTMNSSLFCINRTVFLALNGFREDLLHLEDTEFTLHLLSHGYHILENRRPLGEVLYPTDSKLSYLIRRFHKSYWEPKLLNILGFDDLLQPVAKKFSYSDWKYPSKWFLFFMDFFSLLGNASGKIRSLPQNIRKGRIQSNLKNAFYFNFSYEEKRFHLKSNIGIIWFEDCMYIYDRGKFKRAGTLKETYALKLLGKDRDCLDSLFIRQWLKDGLFHVFYPP